MIDFVKKKEERENDKVKKENPPQGSDIFLKLIPLNNKSNQKKMLMNIYLKIKVLFIMKKRVFEY
jgi:hypothetical protein